MQPLTAYISGHIDLDEETFFRCYKENIDQAIEAGHWFIVGNARGADELAIQYLKEKGVDKSRVLIYYYVRDESDPRQLKKSQLRGFPWSDGFKSYKHRDECATKDSDYDILWVRPAKETEEICKTLGIPYNAKRISGTEKNVIRRKKLVKQIPAQELFVTTSAVE
jgi:hypothetical protein